MGQLRKVLLKPLFKHINSVEFCLQGTRKFELTDQQQQKHYEELRIYFIYVSFSEGSKCQSSSRQHVFF